MEKNQAKENYYVFMDIAKQKHQENWCFFTTFL